MEGILLHIDNNRGTALWPRNRQ